MWVTLGPAYERRGTGIASIVSFWWAVGSVLPRLWLVHWEDHKITLSWWILSHENPWIWANFQDSVMSKYHNISWSSKITQWQMFNISGFRNLNKSFKFWSFSKIFKTNEFQRFWKQKFDHSKWSSSGNRVQGKGLVGKYFYKYVVCLGYRFSQILLRVHLQMFTLLIGGISQH